MPVELKLALTVGSVDHMFSLPWFVTYSFGLRLHDTSLDFRYRLALPSTIQSTIQTTFGLLSYAIQQLMVSASRREDRNTGS